MTMFIRPLLCSKIRLVTYAIIHGLEIPLIRLRRMHLAIVADGQRAERSRARYSLPISFFSIAAIGPVGSMTGLWLRA